MPHYKKTYSDEEIQEVVNWFKARMEQLPQSLEIPPAIKIADLKRTVNIYIEIAAMHQGNTTYSAQLSHLFMMRDRLIEVGGFE